MILIVSEKSDESTFQVCDWLTFLRKDFILINDYSIVKVLSCNINEFIEDFTLQIDDEIINTSQLEVVWFRRGGIKLTYHNLENLPFEALFVENVEKYIIKETSIISEYLTKHLLSKRSIGAPIPLNKLKVLSLAKKIGLRIPNTQLLKNRQDLELFMKKHESLISKGIYENIHFTFELGKKSLYHPNQIWKNEDISLLPSNFQTTIFQEYIDKKIEIRVFYLLGKCYSMGIFSQNNEQTKVDFRNYDHINPNRNIPINLPKEIEEKIQKLMTECELNCGSVDLIYSTKKEFVFLEVNPMGQFGWLSGNCNYGLEHKIATLL